MCLLPQSDLRRSNLVRLSTGDAHERCWAARIAAGARGDKQSADVGALLVLTGDERPNVRATATAGLVMMIMAGCQDRGVINAVDLALSDAGLHVPLAAAQQLTADDDELLPEAQALLDRLCDHPLTAVRRVAAAGRPSR